jgi:hypothetical protein
MVSSLRTVLALMITGIAAAGCSSGDSNPGPSSHPPDDECASDTRAEPFSAGMTFEGTNGMTIGLTDSDPAPPRLGDNTWTIDLKDSSGAEVADATMTVIQTMVDHGHQGSKTIKVTSLGGGSYKAAPVNFNMSGYWETAFTMKTASGESTVVVKTCIP